MNMLSAKRDESESFEDYRKRLKTVRANLKAYLSGRLIWNTGTYRRKIHGEIGTNN